MFQVCISFDPNGPQYTTEFSDMKEAFAAYTECTEGLPARVAVFCFEQEGDDWKPLLKRIDSGYKKLLKEQAEAAQ